MDYITVGGNGKKTYMRIKKNKSNNGATVSRISCRDYDDPKKNKDIGKIVPMIGDKVIIIIKPYNKFNCKTGIVDRVLTKKKYHSRGFKVMIHTGEIGRTLKILTLQ